MSGVSGSGKVGYGFVKTGSPAAALAMVLPQAGRVVCRDQRHESWRWWTIHSLQARKLKNGKVESCFALAALSGRQTIRIDEGALRREGN